MKVRIRRIVAQSRRRLIQGRFSSLAIVVSLSCLYGFTLFYGLDRHPLPGYDDAIYAHEAKDLFNRNAFLDVRFNGRARHENPPLLDWSLLLSFSVFGVNDFAARFPAALSAWFMFWLLLGVCRELELDQNSTGMTLLVFAGSGYLVQYARRSMTDVPFAALILLAIWLMLKARRHRNLLVAAGLAGGVAALLKSVFALLFLLFVILVLVRHRKSWTASKPLIALSLLAFFIPFGIWLIALYPQYRWSPLGIHFVQSKVWGDVSPFHYLNTLWGRYQPWYIFWLLGLLLNLRRMDSFRASFLMLWTFSFLIPLSLAAAKVTRYLLAIFPAMALTTVTPAFGFMKPNRQRGLMFLVALLYIGAIGLFTFSPDKLDQPAEDHIRILAPQTGPCNERVLLYQVPEDVRNQFLWYADCYVEEISDQAVLAQKLAEGRLALTPRSLNLAATQEVGWAGDWSLRVRQHGTVRD